jgi:hypothetical protein
MSVKPTDIVNSIAILYQDSSGNLWLQYCNGTSVLFSTIASGGNFTIQNVVPISGFTVVSNGSNALDLNPATTLSSLTIDFPASPVNGQLFYITSTQSITSLTLSSISTIQGYSGATAWSGSVLRYRYNLSQNTWLIN